MGKVLAAVNERKRSDKGDQATRRPPRERNAEIRRELREAPSQSEPGSTEQPKGRLQFPKLPTWDPSSVSKLAVTEKTEKVRLGSHGAVSERLRVDFSKYMRPTRVVSNVNTEVNPRLDAVKEQMRSSKALKKAAGTSGKS